MTDLKALRREIAEEAAKYTCGSSGDYEVIVDAMQKYAEACLGAPSGEMWKVGQDMRGRDFKINEIWTAMASQRLKEIK